MTYVDGFLIPVPQAHQAEYRRMAELAAAVFIENGALHVSENWGDDLMKGETTDFFRAVKAQDGENVVFSWITWPDRETRDRGNKAAMEDSRFAEFENTNVFDGKRMIFSGFQNMVDRKA